MPEEEVGTRFSRKSLFHHAQQLAPTEVVLSALAKMAIARRLGLSGS
jgi:hypothetical protein